MNETREANNRTTEIIQVPEYYYAVDINYLTHMIGIINLLKKYNLLTLQKKKKKKADMLTRLISHNDRIPLTPNNLTRFHSRTPPNISLSDYLRRIVKYTSVEKSCLLILLIYIDRICELHPHFTVSSLTVHRFLITAVTVSSKALCDSYCTNSHYAKVGGISTHEINALELEFLRLIDWHLSSTGPILQQYYANLVEQHPCYERIKSKQVDQSNGKKRQRSVDEEDLTEHALKKRATEGEIKEDCLDENEEVTYKHFDTLLKNDSIPYIA